MKPPGREYRVAVVGAKSLLGRELVAVIKQRHFPVSSLIEIEASGQSATEPDLPVLDIEKDEAAEFLASAAGSAEIDLAFVAARPDPAAALLDSARPPLVIDLDDSLASLGQQAPRIAFLEPGASAPVASKPGTAVLASPHPATIVLGALLLRLAARVDISIAVAHVFSPASHIGPRAIDELQKQTVNVLSFQKIPRAVFGSQLAFNLLPRLAGSGSDSLLSLENRVRGELSRVLGGRAPMPALRFFQAPVFYSLAVSLYLETASPLTPAKAAQALAGKRVRISRRSEPSPSQVEATGSADILVDSIVADGSRPSGLWIWAAADNLRLAAQNAVEIAENVLGTGHPQDRVRERVH